MHPRAKIMNLTYQYKASKTRFNQAVKSLFSHFLFCLRLFCSSYGQLCKVRAKQQEDNRDNDDVNELEFFARTSWIITPIYSLWCCTCTSSSGTSCRRCLWHVIVLTLYLDFFLNLLDFILLSIYHSFDCAYLVLKRSSIHLATGSSSLNRRSLTLRHHLRRVVHCSGRGRFELLRILGLCRCRRHTRAKDIGLFGRGWCRRSWCTRTCSLHVNWQFEGV